MTSDVTGRSAEVELTDQPGEADAIGRPDESLEVGLDLASRLSTNDQGLVPAIVQEASSRQVLMLAWMDLEALRRTLRTGRATYWSRSRQQYWVKGETSGHAQHVRQVRLDCDGDAILLLVDQTGPACHTGSPTCFDEGVIAAEPPTERARLEDEPATEPARLEDEPATVRHG